MSDCGRYVAWARKRPLISAICRSQRRLEHSPLQSQQRCEGRHKVASKYKPNDWRRYTGRGGLLQRTAILWFHDAMPRGPKRNAESSLAGTAMHAAFAMRHQQPASLARGSVSKTALR